MTERLARPAQVVELRRVLERIAAHAADCPRILFDLDGTLINNRPRSCAIFRELAVHWQAKLPYQAQRLAEITPQTMVFSLRENLQRAGVFDGAHMSEAFMFWRDRFFFDRYLAYDEPEPGAIAFARACYDAGATLVYFTGRDLQNMALGTVQSLRDHGFPIGVPGVELVLKAEPSMNDFEYKQLTMHRLERGGKVVAGFDNEPSNCNLYKESFPDSQVFLLDTGHVPNAPELDPGIFVVGDLEP